MSMSYSSNSQTRIGKRRTRTTRQLRYAGLAIHMADSLAAPTVFLSPRQAEEVTSLSLVLEYFS